MVRRSVDDLHRDAAPDVAWLLVAALTAVALVSFVLRVVERSLNVEAVADVALLSLVVCGAVILNQQPQNRLGWVFLAAGTAAVVSANIRDGSLPAFAPTVRSPWINLVGDLTWPFGFPLLITAVPLLYPYGRLEARWRWAGHVAKVGVALLLFSSVAGERNDASRGGANPLAIGAQVIPRYAMPVGLVLVAIAAVAGLVRLVSIRRSGDAVTRRQVRDMLALTAATGALVALAAVVGSFVRLPGWVEGALPALVVLGYPVAVTVAVLRRRLLDYSFVLNRSSMVRLSQVGAGVATMGALAVVSGSREVATETAFFLGVVGCAGGALAAAAVGRVTGRKLVGVGADPARMLELLPDGGGHGLPLERWAGVVRDAVGSPRVELDVTGRSVVVIGPPVDLPHVEFPLGEGDNLGRLLVAQRSAAERFGRRETSLLAGLAALIASAVRQAHMAELARHAQRSLSEVIAAERDRLHRDLHDQLGPSLAGIGYLLSAVDASPATVSHLEAARAELVSVAGDVRRLARDLQPRPVEQFGLAEAIRRQASQWAGATAIDVRLTLGETEHVPDRVAAAVYSVALEAMSNVERHASASSCSIVLRQADGWIQLEVADDGVGLLQQQSSGIGLDSMRRRAVDLGGRFAIACDRGTRVSFEVPAGG